MLLKDFLLSLEPAFAPAGGLPSGMTLTEGFRRRIGQAMREGLEEGRLWAIPEVATAVPTDEDMERYYRTTLLPVAERFPEALDYPLWLTLNFAVAQVILRRVLYGHLHLGNAADFAAALAGNPFRHSQRFDALRTDDRAGFCDFVLHPQCPAIGLVTFSKAVPLAAQTAAFTAVAPKLVDSARVLFVTADAAEDRVLQDFLSLSRRVAALTVRRFPRRSGGETGIVLAEIGPADERPADAGRPLSCAEASSYGKIDLPLKKPATWELPRLTPVQNRPTRAAAGPRKVTVTPIADTSLSYDVYRKAPVFPAALPAYCDPDFRAVMPDKFIVRGLKFQDIIVAELNDVHVSHLGLLVTQDGALLKESCLDIVRPGNYQRFRPTETEGEFIYHEPPDVPVIEEPVIMMTSALSPSLGHWLMEILPRYFMLKDLPYGQDARLLVNRRHVHPYDHEICQIVGADPSRLLCIEGDVFCRKVIFINCGAWNHHVLCADLDRWLEETVIDRSVQTPKLMYLSRKDASRRRLINDDEVQAYLESRGFQTIYGAEMTLLDKLRFNAQADVTIGPHGSNLQTCIFQRPGSAFIEMNPTEWLYGRYHWEHFWWSACVKQLRYGVVTGPQATGFGELGADFYCDQFITMKSLRSVVDQALDEFKP